MSKRGKWCRGKVTHATIESAAAHIVALAKYNANRPARTGKRLAVYWCDVHACYHIGHQAENRSDGLIGNEEARTVLLPPLGPDV